MCIILNMLFILWESMFLIIIVQIRIMYACACVVHEMEDGISFVCNIVYESLEFLGRI